MTTAAVVSRGFGQQQPSAKKLSKKKPAGKGSKRKKSAAEEKADDDDDDSEQGAPDEILAKLAVTKHHEPGSRVHLDITVPQELVQLVRGRVQ